MAQELLASKTLSDDKIGTVSYEQIGYCIAAQGLG